MSKKLHGIHNVILVRSSVLLLGISLFMSCAEAGKKTEKTDRITKADKKEISKKNSNLFEVEGKVFSIPSPIQTAFLLKEVGTDYQSDLLNPTENASKYNTTYAKALNLGIYGADLGYATIYDQSQDAVSYMAVSRRMSNEIGISALFDEAMIQRFEANIGNQDSLLVLVSDAFKKSDKYLKNNKQKDVSVLILAGGWIETLHFATNLVKTNNSNAIRNRIGEQKITIKNLINLLLPFKENPMTAKLVNQLNELKDMYGGIEFSYTYHPPKTDPEKKTTEINSTSRVQMSDKQMEDIAMKVKEIRNDIIN